MTRLPSSLAGLRIAGASIGLTVLEIVHFLVRGLPMPWADVPWWLLSNLLTITVLGLIVLHSHLRGPRLALSVWVVYTGVYATMIIDAAVMPGFTDNLVESAVSGLVVSVLLAFGLVILLGRWDTEQGRDTLQATSPKRPRRSVFGWLWRIAAGDVAYMLIGGVAGVILFMVVPGIDEFYEDLLPGPVTLLIVHFLVRVPMLIFVIATIIHSTSLSRVATANLTAVTMSSLLGVAPLVRPVEELPDLFRYGHIVEAGISLLLFGWVLGYLFGYKDEPVGDTP